MKRQEHASHIYQRRRERRRMQLLMAGMSLVLLGPNVFRAAGFNTQAEDAAITLVGVEGPFAALSVDGGVATGAALQSATPGMRVAWVLRFSAHAESVVELTTRLVRQQDQVTAAWSQRELCVAGKEPRSYIVEQTLPADLKPGRYQILPEAAMRGSAGVTRLPSTPIDVAAKARS